MSSESIRRPSTSKIQARTGEGMGGERDISDLDGDRGRVRVEADKQQLLSGFSFKKSISSSLNEHKAAEVTQSPSFPI